MAKGIKRKLDRVYLRVNKEIISHASGGGLYAKGLAGEGYNGGYADALQDVLLALNGVKPNRCGWWRGEEFDV